MALTDKQVTNVCNGNGSAPVCKYLATQYDKVGQVVFTCTKLTPSAYRVLQKVRTQYGTWGSNPTGDNCSGYPLLLLVPQGYDVK